VVRMGNKNSFFQEIIFFLIIKQNPENIFNSIGLVNHPVNCLSRYAVLVLAQNTMDFLMVVRFGIQGHAFDCLVDYHIILKQRQEKFLVISKCTNSTLLSL
jgi:hypothetical protein